MTDFENSIVSAICDCIDRHTYCDWDESEGLYCCEIYADYRDEAEIIVDPKHLTGITKYGKLS